MLLSFCTAVVGLSLPVPLYPFSPSSMSLLPCFVFCTFQVSEGLGAAMAPNLAVVWPLVMAGLSDPHPGVRRNSCFAVGHVLSVAGAAGAAAAPAAVEVRTLHGLIVCFMCV